MIRRPLPHGDPQRYLREVMIPRIAPVNPQLILRFVAKNVPGLPKSS